jgi:hypothetical protein
MRDKLLQYIKRRDYLNSLLNKSKEAQLEVHKLNLAIPLLKKQLKKAGVLCNCCDSCVDENVSPLNCE